MTSPFSTVVIPARSVWRALGIAAWAACLLGSAAAAEDASRERGVRLAREGRCASALPVLDAARLAAPTDTELALLAGQCRLRLHRYADAAADLEQATELAPDDADVWLGLAKARYHTRDFVGAELALDRASSGLPDDAELWLYGGMLELERGEAVIAASSLERAIALDAERVEPVASYYLGIARAQAQDIERAGPALERVSSLWQGTSWSTRAEQELRRLRAGSRRHAWLSAGASFEYDSNVVLLGRGVALPSDISNEADGRGVWNANGGIELYKGETATVGTMVSYLGITHVDLTSYDSHFPSVTAWVDLDLAETTQGTARYDFGYAWLDGVPFLAVNSWQASLLRAWPGFGATEVLGRATLDEYFFDSDDVPSGSDCMLGSICGPPGIDESRERRRSGWGLGAGIGHTLPFGTGDLPLQDGTLRGGYAFDHFQARGSEYTHDAHDFSLGLSVVLPLEIGFDARGSFTFKHYDSPSTFPDPPVPGGIPYELSGLRRRDQVYRVETILSRALTEVVSVSGHWRYTDNNSNRSLFDYERHVAGVTVTVRMGREL